MIPGATWFNECYSGPLQRQMLGVALGQQGTAQQASRLFVVAHRRERAEDDQRSKELVSPLGGYTDMCTRVANSSSKSARFIIGKEGQPMAEMGYVLSSEEMSPNEMVRNAHRAAEAGFTTAWISDHYHPWIDAQGQSPFVWSVIGGIVTPTEGIRLGTGVTAP